MLVHDHTKKLLDTLFDKLKKDGVTHPFFLLHGPTHMGKSLIAQDYIKMLLGANFHSDFLLVKDYSVALCKQHSLKVEYKKNEMSDNLLKEHNYQDLGAREIKEWLSRSSLGHYKIVLIENIERMTISAANALLKAIEEPGENRLIIATTGSLTALLDTIVSRALLIKCHLPLQEQLSQRLREQVAGVTQDDAKTIAKLAQGRSVFAERMAEMVLEEHDDSLLDYWKQFKSILMNDLQLVALYKLFERINKAGLLKDFLQLLHYDAIEQGLREIDEAIVMSKKYLASNVGADSVLLHLAKQFVG